MIRAYFKAYRRKIINKLFGVVYLHAKGKRKGSVLLSFMTSPFTLAPGERFTDAHSNYWACTEIARLFLVRGYDVDVIDYNNKKFVPKKKYSICIDLQHNLERLSPLLPLNCIKIAHLVSSYPPFQNAAEQKRIDDLEKRKGVRLPQKRSEPPSKNPMFANFLEGYGNKSVHGTFNQFRKKITPIPIPSMEVYDFPENKDFNKTRKHFLWFGGGGAILKGLDLVIEAFAEMPEFHISIVGPSVYEKEFEKIYARELALPNINRYGRPRVAKNGKAMVGNKTIKEIMDECAGIIFLSASEGGAGATVAAMQAGLIPIVTPQSGIDEGVDGIVIENPTIENIKRVVTNFSKLTPEKIKNMSRNVWLFARNHHSKEAFTKAFNNFLDNELKLK